jgi:hypothetical protein
MSNKNPNSNKTPNLITAKRLKEYGEAVWQMMEEYMREITMAVRLLNIGAPSVAMTDDRGHVTILHREPLELGGFSKARGQKKKLVELPAGVEEKLEEMATLLKKVGERLTGIPELADIEIEGVRLPQAMRRLAVAAVLQRPELFRELQEVDRLREEIAAQVMELMSGAQLPACPHKDPETGRVCGLSTRPIVLYNTHIEVLGLQHVAQAVSALARAEQLIRATGFDRYMRLQGVGSSALMFLFWAAAVNREPDRPSRLFSYLGLAPAAYCPKCNTLYKGMAKYCPRCGHATVPTLPTKAVSALAGNAPIKVRIEARTRAWVLGQVLLSQARLGRAPSAMAAIADLAALHYQRYMDCWHRSGKNPDAMLEHACAGLKLITLAKKYPSRYEELAVMAAVENALWELVKVYIYVAITVAAYLTGCNKSPEPYGQHKRFWPPTVFWKVGEEPPADYVQWLGFDPEEERRIRQRLIQRGAKLATIYQQKRKAEDQEAWLAWKEVFAAAAQTL